MRMAPCWRWPLALAILAAASLTAAAPPPEPEGYRTDHYNDVVPETLKGATVTNAKGLEKLIAEGAVLVDVMPLTRKPDALPEGQIWLPKPRKHVPGSLWWPEVGRGFLSAELEEWFKTHLRAVTGNRLDKALVFYCKAECWMSWNAAKRAVSYGYSRVVWFPGGPEEWREEGHPLVEAHPEDVPFTP